MANKDMPTGCHGILLLGRVLPVYSESIGDQVWLFPDRPFHFSGVEMNSSSAPQPSQELDLVSFTLDDHLNISAHLSLIAVLVLLLVIGVGFFARYVWLRRALPTFEIDQAEFGIGDQKVTLRPNELDRTVAYKIWVELSTRKIGLPINPEHDLIVEIYDSWYEFFSITRELIKDVPVRKFANSSTQKVIELSIEVLNQGLRPHLTQWQARFRRWYAKQLDMDVDALEQPQEIQKRFPAYDELVGDMKDINQRLMAYRTKMRRLVEQG